MALVDEMLEHGRKKCPKITKSRFSPIAAESTSTRLQISQINVAGLLCIQFNFEVKWTLFGDDRKKIHHRPFESY